LLFLIQPESSFNLAGFTFFIKGNNIDIVQRKKRPNQMKNPGD